MVGINVDNLNALIKKNNLYLNSYNSNSKKLVGTINELKSCYAGSSLEYLFSEPINEIKNLQSIPGILGNYSNVLAGVKLSYQQQDQKFQTQINRINQNLK